MRVGVNWLLVIAEGIEDFFLCFYILKSVFYKFVDWISLCESFLLDLGVVYY